MIKQTFVQSPNIRIMINIGSCLDIPTGSFLKGMYNDNILLGGLGSLTGITGIPNSFKSLITNYMMLSAADKIESTAETSMSTYDTEVSTHENRLRSFLSKFSSFCNRDVLTDGTWVVTDKTVYAGNKWYELLKEFLNSKQKNAKSISCTLPFYGRDRETQLKVITPTYTSIDSLTHFGTEDVGKMQDENELGESGGNMLHARQGLAKTRLLMELPTIAASSNHFVLITAHMGKDIQLASGPFAPSPTKKLQHTKLGDKVKGVTDQFLFLMSNFWQTTSASTLINQSTKAPEYPRNPDDNMVNDTDLNIVTLKLLRSKSGPSGVTINIIISQSEGVLPSLTEFHFIKENNRFGISGTLQHYSLDLLPDIKLSRTTIRSKIDDNIQLRRAINITSELLQMHQYYRHLKEILPTPKELFDDLVKQGFDMNVLLNTRGWYTVNDDKHPIPRLSTLDLVYMTTKVKELRPQDAYFPFWMNPDKCLKKPYV